VPAISPYRGFVVAGGLMGTDPPKLFRQVGVYTGRFSRAQSPLQQSVKIELVINMRTTKALPSAISPPGT
jgi:hypothetical protein